MLVNNMTKRIILTCFLVIWMIVIFMFSNETGEASKNRSDGVARTTINVVTEVTNKNISKKEKEKMVDNTKAVIRKIAHFTLYFILGILVYFTLNSYGISKRIIIYSIGFCFIYAITDEIHQIFTTDRSFKVLDIFIDTSGATLSNLIIFLIKNHKKSA